MTTTMTTFTERQHDVGSALVRTTHHLLASALADLAKFASPAAAKRWAPAGRVLVEGRGDTVALTVWDLDTAATVELPTELATGRFVVEHAQLVNVLRGTGKGRPAAEKRGRVELGPDAFVDLDGASHALDTVDVDQHSTAPAHLVATWRGATSTVRNALGTALRAAGDDDTLPMLAVVNLVADEEDRGALQVTSTDRFRLEERRVRPADPARDASLEPVHVPALPLERAVSRYRDGGSIGLATRDDWCTITGPTVTHATLTMSTRPYEAEVPRVAQLWPAGGASVTVDRAALVRLVETTVGEIAKTPAQRERVLVRLSADLGEIEVSARSEEGLDDGEETAARAADAVVELDERGGPLTRTVRAVYLADALAASEHATVTVVVPLPRTRPALVSGKPEGGYTRPVGMIAFVDRLDDLVAEKPPGRHLLMCYGQSEHVEAADLQPWDGIDPTTGRPIGGRR